MHKIAFGLLCAMVFCIPWENSAVIPGVQTIFFAVGCAMMATAGLAILSRGRVRRPPMAYFILGLSVAWIVLSVLWAVDSDTAQRRAITFAALLVFAGMIVELCNSNDRMLWIFRSYVFGSGVSLVNQFIAYVAGRDIYFDAQVRYSASGLNANDLATILSISVPMAAHLASAAKKTAYRNFYWAYIPVACVGVFLTGSRSGILSLGAGLVLSAIALRMSGKRAVMGLLASSILALILLPQLVSRQVFSRLAEGSHASTFHKRVVGWKAGLSYWSDHPVLGSGTGSYAAVAGSRMADSLVAHNTFVSVLVEGGLVGFILMAAFWIMLARLIYFMERRERLLWFAILAVWTIGSMALSWEYAKSTWLIYACVLAQGVSRREERVGKAAGKA